jgi:hypothetical protein
MMDGRWTIVRDVAPATRDLNRRRRRVLARCFCGRECIIWLDDIQQGRSHGCRSRRCQALFEASCAVRVALSEWAHGKPGTHPFELMADPIGGHRDDVAASLTMAFDKLFRRGAKEAQLECEE